MFIRRTQEETPQKQSHTISHDRDIQVEATLLSVYVAKSVCSSIYSYARPEDAQTAPIQEAPGRMRTNALQVDDIHAQCLTQAETQFSQCHCSVVSTAATSLESVSITQGSVEYEFLERTRTCICTRSPGTMLTLFLTMTILLPTQYVYALDMGKQSRAGALGLLMYDYFLTFGLEVEVVWTEKKWNKKAFWLYIFNRFLPLVWLVLDTIPFEKSGVVSSKICVIYLAMDHVAIAAATISVQVILQLRVYALYEEQRRIGILLVTCCIVELIATATVLALTFIRIGKLPVVSTPTGCYYSGISSISGLIWLPALTFELFLCLLVVWKAWGDVLIERLYRARGVSTATQFIPNMASQTPKLFSLFAQDSLMYFIGMSMGLTISTIIWSRYDWYINLVVPWSGALPSILGSRLFLRMREAIIFPKRFETTNIAHPAATTDGDSEDVVWRVGSRRDISQDSTTTSV